MFIAHIGSEFSPIAKVGGLGDVIYGLSRKQIELGHDVLVILPKYQSLALKEVEGLAAHSKKKIVFPSGIAIDVFYWTASCHGVSLLLIEPKAPMAVFERNAIYGEKDDVFRFLLFSYLAIDYLVDLNVSSQMIHCHDWQASFSSVFFEQIFKKRAKNSFHFLLTIHNLMHQGREQKEVLDLFCLPVKKEYEDPRDPQMINLLKAGMYYAEKITTVSPTYAKEILTPFFSYYLDEVLWKCKDKLTGILNGISMDYWNPYDENHVLYPFPQNPSVDAILNAKKANKRALLEKLHLKPSNSPLFCVITRLDSQKSPELIKAAALYVTQKNCPMVILGKTEDFGTKERMRELEEHLKPSLAFYYREDFDEDLAKMLYMSCDFIVIPSSFEPCGLTQMIAMRYGTIPVARKTGGLADTVFEEPAKEQTGFIFNDLAEQAMNDALSRAISFYEKKELYAALVEKITKIDHSWRASAELYIKLYTSF